MDFAALWDAISAPVFSIITTVIAFFVGKKRS